jgi:hypothetical protein
MAARNPYAPTARGGGRGGSRPPAAAGQDQSDPQGRKPKGNFFAAYPVETSMKDLLMQWIKAYLTKRKTDGNGIEWQQGPLDGKVALANVPGKPGKVFNALGDIKGPFPEDRRSTNYLFSPVDMQSKDRIKQFVEQHLPGPLFENGVLNVSDLATNCGQPAIEFAKNPNPLTYLLFMCAVRCREQGLQVHSIKCENNKLTGTRSFQPVKRFFPELRQISLAGNDPTTIQKDKNWKLCFPDVEVSFEGITELSGGQIYRGWGSRIVFDPGPYEVTIPLTLPDVGARIEMLASQRQPLSLDGFPRLRFDAENSIVDRFLSSLFEIGARNMRDIGQFYWPTALFSITVDVCDPSSQMARVFGEFDGNLLRAQADVAPGVAGRDAIVRKYFDLFRSGFYARPTAASVSVKAPEFGTFVIRGVFALSFDEKSVLGFHRSLVVLEKPDGCAILNDHLFIHEMGR